MRNNLIIAGVMLAAPITADASDLEDLAREGFGVLLETRVDGDFEGCDYDKQIPLTNGMVFVCSSYRYKYGYNAEVLILKNVRSDEIKVMIHGDEMRGKLFRK